MEPKNDENCYQERSKRWSFLWSIWRSIFEAIWCQLGSILTPKTLPKWGQVGSQIDPSWSVDLRVDFWWMLDRFLLNFVPNVTWPKCQKWHTHYTFGTFLIFGCCVVWMICWLIFGRFLIDSGFENRAKIDPKSIQKAIENKMRFGMDFGGLLEWFWNDFGPKLGAKLGPSWHQNRRKWGYQDDVKKSLKNWRRGGTQVAAGNRSAGP